MDLLAKISSNRKLGTCAPLLIYLTLSFAFFGRNVNWSEYYLGYCADTLLFIWCLHWWPFALSHGLNPFICKYVWFPTGYNFAWATSIPFLALLCWPITILGSPVLSYNILTLAAPALAAFTAFLLGRELTRNWTAALICGALFGFSAPELTQMGELNLNSVFLIPLALLLCVRHLRGTLNRLPFIISLSLLLAAQLGISIEMMTTLCLTGGLTWAVFLRFTPAAARGPFWRLAGDIALAAPLTMLLTAPFLYYLITGLPDVPTQIHTPVLENNEALQFIFPTVPLHSAMAALTSIARQVYGFSPVHFTYLGLPLLLLLACYFYRHISKAYVKALLVLICILAVLSLGLTLAVNGHATKIPLPWALFSHVPIIRCILPVRFLTYLTLGTAIATAFFLAEAKTTGVRAWRFALAGLVCLFLPPAKVQVLPLAWVTQPIFQPQTEFKWSRWPQHPFFTPAHIAQALGPMPNVILLPDPVVGPGMAWQLNAGLSFTQGAGYIGFKLGADQKWSVLDDTVWDIVKPDFSTVFPAFCAAHRVDYVLIAPGTPPAVTSAIEALGWPHHMDSGIEIVKTPAALH